MKPSYLKHHESAMAHDERRLDKAAREPRAEESPASERRGTHRVSDDQKSGQGSLSALSKLKMMERKRDAIKPRHDESAR